MIVSGGDNTCENALSDLDLGSRADVHMLGTLICSALYRISRVPANLGS